MWRLAQRVCGALVYALALMGRQSRHGGLAACRRGDQTRMASRIVMPFSRTETSAHASPLSKKHQAAIHTYSCDAQLRRTRMMLTPG